jgi:hypothetical protein
MLAGDGGAQNMAGNRAALPTVILFTIVLAWAVIYRYARPSSAPVATPAQASAQVSAQVSAHAPDAVSPSGTSPDALVGHP